VTIDDDEVPAIAVLVGTVSAILLFIALQTFGSYVLMGVVEEKSTAVIEVLLARAAPDQLLAGKVIGIGLCAAVQMAAAVGAGLVALAVSGRSIPADIWSTIPMVLVWFLGGYALYSTLFALAGSLVSRQEDAQAASAPIMTVMIAAYLAVFTFGYAPRSTASTVLSIFPPTAPLLMPMRMAAGAAAWWQVLLAVVLLVAAILGAWKLAGRIYGAVVLQRGTRISWKEALAAGRARA
jgi:ABC-2 type transport system permease protein